MTGGLVRSPQAVFSPNDWCSQPHHFLAAWLQTDSASTSVNFFIYEMGTMRAATFWITVENIAGCMKVWCRLITSAILHLHLCSVTVLSFPRQLPVDPFHALAFSSDMQFNCWFFYSGILSTTYPAGGCQIHSVNEISGPWTPLKDPRSYYEGNNIIFSSRF